MRAQTAWLGVPSGPHHFRNLWTPVLHWPIPLQSTVRGRVELLPRLEAIIEQCRALRPHLLWDVLMCNRSSISSKYGAMASSLNCSPCSASMFEEPSPAFEHTTRCREEPPTHRPIVRHTGVSNADRWPALAHAAACAGWTQATSPCGFR